MSTGIRKDILKDWNVVIVDDEPDSLEVATRILRFYGATVNTATNGKEGLTVIMSQRPKFIISDLSMPQLDGWGMLHALQQDRSISDIPVIALTAHNMPGDRARAIEAGFYNYLTKPLTASNFMTDLLRLLIELPEFKTVLTA